MNPEVIKSGIVNVSFGPGVKIVEPVNLYGCIIGKNVFIGPFVEIQKNSRVGDNSRIQSHSFICELVTIGESCIIGHGVVFINDLFLDKKSVIPDTSKWKPTSIGNHVYIGSNATILPVRICDNVTIGAGAVVTSDITIPGKYVGNPAVRIP